MSCLPTVREFMDRHVQTISPDADIMEAVDFLLEKRVTGALVANSKSELVGMLTEFDCLRLLTHGDARAEAPRGKVRDFMTSDVQTIPPTMESNMSYSMTMAFLDSSQCPSMWVAIGRVLSIHVPT